jgi:hypothetical protein
VDPSRQLSLDSGLMDPLEATHHRSDGPATALSRRGFLRGTAGGTAAAAAAALVPAGCGRSYPQADAAGVSLKALSPKEFAVARAAAEALLPGVPVDPGAVAAAIDAELAVAGEPMQSDMKTVLALMEHGTALSFRRGRFTALPTDARLAVLDDWARSRFNLRRAAYQALRGFVLYFAWIDDATRPITRFPGPWPERVQVPVYPVDFGGIG